jgi:hypothetical protein
LNEEELNALNRMVSAYLEIAEIQALNRQPMYMKDWVERLDDFIKMTGNVVLQNAGSISHLQALEKATNEYEKYKAKTKNELSKVENDFIKQIEDSTSRIGKPKL